ncbi:hypothetical protein [Streptomyces sp. NPDC102360]|uniref:hypothetical protein n=1 Tax=Streptomyces sp. NPDC102360 TaxID=3366160 RepID=UPI0037F12EA2
MLTADRISRLGIAHGEFAFLCGADTTTRRCAGRPIFTSVPEEATSSWAVMGRLQLT